MKKLVHQSGQSGGDAATHLHGVSGRRLEAAGVGGGVWSVRCPGGKCQSTWSRGGGNRLEGRKVKATARQVLGEVHVSVRARGRVHVAEPTH